MLKIDETTRDDGSLESVHLHADGEELSLVSGGVCRPLPDGVLDPVMRRYGAPLEPDAVVTEVATLELGGATRLRHVRHLARYDVIAKDWLVYERPGEEPLCALAVTVAGALAHLARVSG
jgi:hypothetical protein